MTKTQSAIDFIVRYCPHIGSFSTVNYIGDVSEYLLQVATEINESPDTEVFPGRIREHIAYAVATVANHSFRSSPSAMASAYLLTRFEYYFRILSGVLNPDGTWIDQAAQARIVTALPKLKGKQRIADVYMAYQVLKQGNAGIVTVFDQLDKQLFTGGSQKITDIGARIGWIRHPTAHGGLGDPSGEAVFYALLTAIVFYNQN